MEDDSGTDGRRCVRPERALLGPRASGERTGDLARVEFEHRIRVEGRARPTAVRT